MFVLYADETGPQKNPRGGLFRWLTRDEELAVKNISGLRDFTDRTQYTLNNNVLREMRQLGAWLQCDCIPGDSPAMNSANLYRDTGTLFLSGFNHEHTAACPMYRPFSGDAGATSSGTRKHAGVSLEIGNFCTLSALFNQSWCVRD